MALPTKLPPGIQAERVQRLNSLPPSGDGKYVLYWMQRSVRTEYNHALEYAIHTANAMGLPVCVLFVLTQGYPGANERHYAFLLQGLADALSALQRRGVRLATRLARDGSVPAAVLRHAADAAVLVTDRGYTRVLRGWREEVGGGAQCAVVQVCRCGVVWRRVGSNVFSDPPYLAQ
ncbi:deoxyribodipyrimidine photolyase 2 [Tribonema minus]|uniref:Deoxyribodipyrimidine photolyase 2 n=1 Tax=Tribonema minus TaxID=303371 RepID=A0A835YRH2_9STRA|nr:deoxyribodipyrimidine photolyase 2 [Tribonema minus]